MQELMDQAVFAQIHSNISIDTYSTTIHFLLLFLPQPKAEIACRFGQTSDRTMQQRWSEFVEFSLYPTGIDHAIR